MGETAFSSSPHHLEFVLFLVIFVTSNAVMNRLCMEIYILPSCLWDIILSPEGGMAGLEGTYNSKTITAFPCIETGPFCVHGDTCQHMASCVITLWHCVGLIVQQWYLGVINLHFSCQHSWPSFPMIQSHLHVCSFL